MKSLFTVNRVNILADGLGISVRELCRRSGIGENTVNSAQSRGSELTLPIIMSICQGAGITLPEFFQDIETSQKS